MPAPNLAELLSKISDGLSVFDKDVALVRNCDRSGKRLQWRICGGKVGWCVGVLAFDGMRQDPWIPGERICDHEKRDQSVLLQKSFHVVTDVMKRLRRLYSKTCSASNTDPSPALKVRLGLALRSTTTKALMRSLPVHLPSPLGFCDPCRGLPARFIRESGGTR